MYGSKWHQDLDDVAECPARTLPEVQADARATFEPDSSDVDAITIEVPVESLNYISIMWSCVPGSERRKPADWFLGYNCAIATSPFTVWLPHTAREAVYHAVRQFSGRTAVQLHPSIHWLLLEPFTMPAVDAIAALRTARITTVLLQAFGMKGSRTSFVHATVNAIMARAGGPPAAWKAAHSFAYFRASVDLAQQFPPVFKDQYSFFDAYPVSDATGEVVRTRGEVADASHIPTQNRLPLQGTGCAKVERYPILTLATHARHGGLSFTFPVLADAAACVTKTKVYSRLRQQHTGLWGGGVSGLGSPVKQKKSFEARLSKSEVMADRMRQPEHWREACGYRVENTVAMRVPMFDNSDDAVAWAEEFYDEQIGACSLAGLVRHCNARKSTTAGQSLAVSVVSVPAGQAA